MNITMPELNAKIRRSRKRLADAALSLEEARDEHREAMQEVDALEEERDAREAGEP